MNDLMTKSFLSYMELKKQVRKDLEAGPDLEMGGLSQADEKNLANFFQEVDAIKTEMDGISNLLLDLQELNQDMKSKHSQKAIRGLRDRMEADMVAVLHKAKVIKTQLEYLDRSNIANRCKSPNYVEGSPVDRTRISVTNGLRSKLRDMMIEFQSLREKIISEHEEELKRRYINPTGQETSKETLGQLPLAGEQVEKAALKDQERQEAVQQIQRSLMELHKMFLDMAILVESQGEEVDDIEQNMARAGDYVSDGTNSLATANERRKSKKCVYWVWAVVLMLILVVCLLPILTHF